ncbi:MAG: hypothetical protein R3307_07805, partial [Anaerolineales bacterium]|nr:hypothetical protein [Anaerolineales bacterium]
REATVTVLRLLSEISAKDVNHFYDEAERKISVSLPKDAHLLYIAALRYLGQGFEVEIFVDDPSDIELLQKKFHETHEHEYGFSIPDAEVEWVELRAFWEVKAKEWDFPATKSNEQDSGNTAQIWEYPLVDANLETKESLAKYRTRNELRPGTMLKGPAIVTERDATTYIPTGWKVHVTDNGYLRIRKDG